MRELTDSEREAMERAWKVHLADDPELASFLPFEAGFIAALEYSDAQLAALQADNAKLRAALQQIADGNPAPPGGTWLSDAKMAQIARSILSNGSPEHSRRVEAAS